MTTHARSLWTSASLCALALLQWSCAKPEAEPVLPQDITDANVLYSQNCAGCHGPNGKNGAAQSLADPMYIQLIPRDKLRDVIEKGVPGTSMPAFAYEQGGPLHKKQIDALMDGLERTRERIPDAAGLPSYEADLTRADMHAGQQAYEAACAGCHAAGKSGGLITNRSYLALTSDQSLRTSIIVGKPEIGMPDWRTVATGHNLTNDEITNIVAWLSTLRAKTQENTK